MRARLLSTVPEVALREDQSDLANWTRGDRKARFEQTGLASQWIPMDPALWKMKRFRDFLEARRAAIERVE